jgi:hypothetical protein
MSTSAHRRLESPRNVHRERPQILNSRYTRSSIVTQPLTTPSMNRLNVKRSSGLVHEYHQTPPHYQSILEHRQNPSATSSSSSNSSSTSSTIIKPSSINISSRLLRTQSAGPTSPSNTIRTTYQNDFDLPSARYRSKSSPKQRPEELTQVTLIKSPTRSKTPQRLVSNVPLISDEPMKLSEHFPDAPLLSRASPRLDHLPSTRSTSRNSFNSTSMVLSPTNSNSTTRNRSSLSSLSNSSETIEPTIRTPTSDIELAESPSNKSICRGMRGLSNLGNTVSILLIQSQF